MTKISIDLNGVEGLQAALSEFEAEMGHALERAVTESGADLVTRIKKGYKEDNKVGRWYEKYNPRRSHQASEEGQAPASDTGRLASSVVFEDRGVLSVEVFSTVFYGELLEFGTMDIAPRPLWIPEAKAAEPRFKKRIEDVLKRFIR